MILLVWLCCLLVPILHGREVGEDTPISPGDQAWLNSLFYLPEAPRIRREYRMLSDGERNTFHGAFYKLKQDKSVSPNKYDLLVSLHARRSSRNSAHRGPGFLGWHRVFTLLMENALREKEPNVTMAYWDSTLDAGLDLPRESCLWSEDFMGNGDGHVNVGVFKDWSTQSGKLYRTVGIMYGPLADKNITRLFKFHHIGNISYPKTNLKSKEDILELTHNRVHRWMGGEMQLIETAADDPFFFIYHSFISLIWEDFRARQRSNGIDPETDWDLYYGGARHHKYSPMGLGNLMAIDGSSEVFTENIVFEKRPSCTKSSVDCGSPYLYCNVSTEKCVTWTVLEYNMLKGIAESTNEPFKDVAKEYIQRKLSGVVDIFTDTDAEAVENDDMDHDHSHDGNMMNEYFAEGHDDGNKGHGDSDDDGNKGHGDSDDDGNKGHGDSDDDGNKGHGDSDDDGNKGHGDSDDDDDHGSGYHHHDHPDYVESRVHSGKIVGTMLEENLPMIILAGCLLMLIILSIISKCVEEKRRNGTKKGKYRMDGIVNANYAESNSNKDERRKSSQSESRFDNIYTITVTSNTGTPQTFVRFAKFGKLTDPHAGSSSASSKVNSSSAPNSVKNTRKDKSNYLDMDYASRIMNDAKSCGSDLYEISLDGSDQESNHVLETTFNSIDNENFDLACSHDRSQSCDTSCYENATKSIDDVLADYDNLVFRTESTGFTALPHTDFGEPDFDESHLT